MAKKNDIKKISITQFENYANTFEEFTEVHLNEELNMVVRKVLPFVEAKAFVNTVVDTCFNDDGEYLPELKRVAIYICTVSLYSNIRIPLDKAKAYYLILKTGIYEKILPYIDMEQYTDIENAISAKIRHRCSIDIQNAKKRFDEAIDVLNNAGEMMTNLFSGVNEEDLKLLVDNMDKFELDEGKIVDAFMDRKLKE